MVVPKANSAVFLGEAILCPSPALPRDNCPPVMPLAAREIHKFGICRVVQNQAIGLC